MLDTANAYIYLFFTVGRAGMEGGGEGGGREGGEGRGRGG